VELQILVGATQAELPGEREVEAWLSREVIDPERVEKPIGVRLLRDIKPDPAERGEQRPRFAAVNDSTVRPA
jgi:hypothetical protein